MSDIISRLTLVTAEKREVSYKVPAHSSLERFYARMSVASLASDVDRAFGRTGSLLPNGILWQVMRQLWPGWQRNTEVRQRRKSDLSIFLFIITLISGWDR